MGSNKRERPAQGIFMTEIVFGGIAQELDRREFDWSEVRLAVFRRFDDDEVGIRNFGTKEGTRRGKVIFDQHRFEDLVRERIGDPRPCSEQEVSRVVNELYEDAAHLGAKRIILIPDYHS